jgi:hypothetical protein
MSGALGDISIALDRYLVMHSECWWQTKSSSVNVPGILRGSCPAGPRREA